MPRKRKTGRKSSAHQGGGNILGLLDTVDKFAKKIKPASMVGDLLHSAGWDKGKVGKVVKLLISANSSDMARQLEHNLLEAGKKEKSDPMGIVLNEDNKEELVQL